MTTEELNILISDFKSRVKDVSITADIKDGIFIYKLTGSIDTFNSLPLGKVLASAFDLQFEKFVFDLSGINYMSSTGVGLFTSLLKECCNKNKKMFLMAIQPKVLEVYDLLGFSQFFDIISDLDEMNKSRKHLFPVELKCPQCSVSLKVPRPGRFACKSCKHIFIVNDVAILEDRGE